MVKKAKVVRKTLKEKVAIACVEARALGWADGFDKAMAEARRKFAPDTEIQDALTDFAQQIRGWPIDGAAVVMLVGTDLKHICNMAIPARTAKAIAGELERLGYKR
ncbi:hypothetical protein [Bradyrhizobium sp. RT9a]|uniref:hypothetical protein n=1 Tax=Bradyrhizobium sp. RT9a TaxID=3156384 RepID=UPI0033955E73